MVHFARKLANQLQKTKRLRKQLSPLILNINYKQANQINIGTRLITVEIAGLLSLDK